MIRDNLKKEISPLLGLCIQDRLTRFCEVYSMRIKSIPTSPKKAWRVNNVFPTNKGVPFEFAVEKVLEQLRTIAKGDYSTPRIEKTKFGNIVYAAVSLPVGEIRSLLDNVTLHWGP
ncbi:tRNA ligase 1 [Camellia lanceoleosa]|uniref:tRNA ligase 1 n=1 Tax=Camellia lanceoleosa TaxID=1840588 RepID=A0ACC0GX25_9ERIC|nr:tRNA ligase 1 [Camellia lanceoleosa]